MQGANASFSAAGVDGENMLANALLSKFTEISGILSRFDTILGRELRGKNLLNKLVYLFSFWFCRTEFWQNPRETSAGEKITLFSALANSIFLPRLCKTDLLSFASSSSCHRSSLAFWLRLPGLVRFPQFWYFFPP